MFGHSVKVDILHFKVDKIKKKGGQVDKRMKKST